MSFYEHPTLINTSDSTIIWRYFDSDKFALLLSQSALFFCRADRFADPFEGSIPRKESTFRISEAKRIADQFGQAFDPEKAEIQIDSLRQMHQRFKKNMLINCWQLNANESVAMWQLYLKNNIGVAIQSTVGKLKKAFETSDNRISGSKVRYLDYENDVWFHSVDYPVTGYNFFTPFVHKRNEYKHETEYRFFTEAAENPYEVDEYWEAQTQKTGKLVQIEVRDIVDQIFFPPTIDEDGERIIKEMCTNAGYEFDFRRSALSSHPIY